MPRVNPGHFRSILRAATHVGGASVRGVAFWSRARPLVRRDRDHVVEADKRCCRYGDLPAQRGGLPRSQRAIIAQRRLETAWLAKGLLHRVGLSFGHARAEVGDRFE